MTLNNSIRNGHFRFLDLTDMSPNNRFPLKHSLKRNDFLSRLLKVSVKDRLGCGPGKSDELLEHPWLQGIDMDKVMKGEYRPLFKPSVLFFNPSLKIKIMI